ncbi:hypothetical protein TWF718_009212 [Orbilia javanica]|uniref:Uncharacterized protein n=1 Tax=Orbilia javanica TaxID=47235 RepID=A0AAN8MUM6_9PEZI
MATPLEYTNERLKYIVDTNKCLQSLSGKPMVEDHTSDFSAEFDPFRLSFPSSFDDSTTVSLAVPIKSGTWKLKYTNEDGVGGDHSFDMAGWNIKFVANLKRVYSAASPQEHFQRKQTGDIQRVTVNIFSIGEYRYKESVFGDHNIWDFNEEIQTAFITTLAQFIRYYMLIQFSYHVRAPGI